MNEDFRVALAIFALWLNGAGLTLAGYSAIKLDGTGFTLGLSFIFITMIMSAAVIFSEDKSVNGGPT